MNIINITDRVSYIGVNDRSKPLFEQLWPLPMGVSFNSYFIHGSEKLAIVDTAPVESIEAYFDNIRRLAADKPVDYLIVNHMEPDHSGLIGLVKKEWPEIKIVVNKVSQNIAKGYSGITDDDAYHVVKDGDTLSLGDVTLRFITIPMVHWPETMVTYAEEEKVLFTCDALGCFGALNGGVVDTQMDTDRYFPEMERYYANIVAKYGGFVQKALSKVSGLDIAYACPSHGPVWHERLGEVIDVYNRLSSWQGEEGVVIAYGSMYGNTARLADRIAAALNRRGIRNIIMYDLSTAQQSYVIRDIVKYKGLILGSPTYNADLFPAVKTLVNAIINREMKNKVFGAFGSYTWAPMALKKLEEMATTLGWEACATMTMAQSGLNLTDEDIDRYAAAFMDKYNA